MKNYFLFAISLSSVLLLSCSRKFVDAVPVGTAENQSPVNSGKIIKDWNSILIGNRIKGSISSVAILKGRDSVNGKDYSYILGKSSNDSIKMAHLLVRHKGKFYFDTENYPLTVICYGCADSYPRMSFDRWGWSCETDNVDNCKKTVIVKMN